MCLSGVDSNIHNCCISIYVEQNKCMKEFVMTIYFYSPAENPYGCFSNFSCHGFELDNCWWPTSEHYFQAQKFVGTPFLEKVHLASNPSEAAKLGRDRTQPLRPDWEQVKDEVMLCALRQKFTCHSDIRAI